MLIVELAFTPTPERLATRPAHRETLARRTAGPSRVVTVPGSHNAPYPHASRTADAVTALVHDVR